MSLNLSSILDHLDSVAVLAGGLFAGSALYITIVEAPAIREVGLDDHWQFFPHVYKRAAASQSCYTAIAGLAGIIHGTRVINAPFYRNLWIAAGSIFLGMFPYTLICMIPTNQTIIDDNKSIKSGKQSEFNTDKRTELLDKWTLLHLVRTVGSIVGFGAMAFGLRRHQSFNLRW